MKLIIAEKPDIAKAVSKVLPGKAQWKNGYIEQQDYCITWCYGHLLTLKDPEDYGDEYARANTPNSKLPIFFPNWGMKVVEKESALTKGSKGGPDKKAQLNVIGTLLKTAALVIVAGDIDDEGQLLVEEVLQWHKYSGPIKRLDTGALNEASLKKAMANLMDNTDWHLRAVSAHARRVADFAFGINGSRFFSNIYHANLSVGRVQTATLGLVVNRDNAIENHTALKYYLLDMDDSLTGFGTYTVRFIPSDNDIQLVDGKIIDKQYLEKLGAALNRGKATSAITKKAVTEQPPLPLSISALKSYCAAKYGLTPEETLQITQALRMNYGGLITYNRSECRYLPENMHAEAPNVIAAVQHNLGPKWNFPGLDANRVSKAFDDKNVGVHHAIIPTTQTADITKLSENELKVYKAICGFYMVQFMPPAAKERTILVAKTSKGEFQATSTRLTNRGFKAVMATTDEAESSLSDIPAGTYPCILSNPNILEKETEPPKRYTESSLEEDMKNVAKYVTDAEAKRLLLLKDKGSKEEHGSIGTAATRSAIIQTLKKRGFLKNTGKSIVSTETGRQFYRILPDEIRKPDLTAKWWAIQQDIQEKHARPEKMYEEVLALYKRVSALPYPDLNLSQTASQSRPEIGACPRCGKPIVEGKKGYGCTGYKDGCSFVLWKEGKYGVYKILSASNKKLTAAMAKSILKRGKVLVRGLVSEKTGKKYDAYIKMTDTGESVLLNLDFDGVPPKKSL